MKLVGLTALAAALLLPTLLPAQENLDLIKKGAQAYRSCAACHSLQPSVHLSGPSLADRWGKKAATIGDYGRYTEALKKSGLIWDEISLNGWLTKPQDMVRGTTMTFRGIDNERTREALIAFLRLAMGTNGAQRVVDEGLIARQLADGQIPEDLSSPQQSQRVASIRHCGDAYYVTMADGGTFPYWETNVRLKVDSSSRGPKKGEPVLARSGMAGDRISVVFSSVADIGKLVPEKC